MMKKHISKRLHGHDIDANLSLRIVAAALELQKGYLEEMKKGSKQKGKHEKRPRKWQNSPVFFAFLGKLDKISRKYGNNWRVFALSG